jgi:hypothetical protein
MTCKRRLNGDLSKRLLSIPLRSETTALNINSETFGHAMHEALESI